MDDSRALSATNGASDHELAALEPSRAALVPFFIGTIVGGVAGAVAGTLLSDQTRRLLLGLIELSGRRLSSSERDQLKFELLLQ